MNNHRRALLILALSLGLGIAWDLLLRWIPWGVNVLLWSSLLVASAFVAARETPRRDLVLPAAFALLAAAGITWRSSEVLIALDILLLMPFLPMLALSARGVRVVAAGLMEIAAAHVFTILQSLAGLPLLLSRDVIWPQDRGRLRGAGVLLRGMVIATPPLILFGSLLLSADAAFEGMIRSLFDFEIPEALLHVVVVLCIGALSAGFLRSLVAGAELTRGRRPGFLTLPAAETNVALLLVNLLFATFVAVQFRYFFGGASLVQLQPGLTRAEYARSGFFELAWVVALVVPMLLVLEWLVEKGNGRKLLTFRLLAGLQVALVLVISVSAWERMRLYRDEFGLTRLRFFTSAFMIWVAVLLVWLAVTVLTGRRQRFAVGVLTTAVATVMTLHAVNPDAVIVRTNLARAAEGKRALDSAYALSLSDDAAAVIAASASSFEPKELSRFASRPRPASWRTWNASRAKAAEAMHPWRSGRRYESKATPPMPRP